MYTIISKTLRNLAGTLFVLSAGIGCANALPSYDITSLGTLGGNFSLGVAVSNSGVVTGSASTLDRTRAFRFDANQGMVDIGSLGGLNSFGRAISSSGLITGSAETASVAQHAFLHDGTQMIDLGTLGGLHSAGLGVNNSGQVTGDSHIRGNGHSHAFLYSAGSMRDLGTLGGDFSAGFAINEAGSVAGFSSLLNESRHAFLYDGAKMIDLGTLPGLQGSQALGINDSGMVTGVSWGGGEERAFLYADGIMRDLGSGFGGTSTGYDVNNHGDVVGWSSKLGASEPTAVLYTQSTHLDLNTLIDPLTTGGWRLLAAYGINDARQITGMGTLDGQYRAFLLTPVNVPEPASFAFLALGFIYLIFARRRDS